MATFLDRMRASSAAATWASRIAFPNVALDNARAAQKMLIAAYVRGYLAATDTIILNITPSSAETAVRAFIAETQGLIPADAPMTEEQMQGAMRGLEIAYRSGWNAAARRRIGHP
jgi:hypothetical protein